MKQCSKCKIAKPDSSFSKYRSECKVCRAAEGRTIYHSTKHHGGINGWNRRYWRNIWSIHRISRDQWIKMWIAQGRGKCKICNRQMKLVKKTTSERLVIDHDHTSGKTRSLICQGCNVMLGSVNDNYLALKNGAIYVKYHARASKRTFK